MPLWRLLGETAGTLKSTAQPSPHKAAVPWKAEAATSYARLERMAWSPFFTASRMQCKSQNMRESPCLRSVIQTSPKETKGWAVEALELNKASFRKTRVQDSVGGPS